ncbi:MAG: MoaF C-terminal domain-containing protein [Microbacterium sp.]|uniref:MoaF C-terminal domain-containing protein n=1 Tax=Microbacterium sp. TaxID=51671 RepID=UPI0039E386E0
MPPTPPAPMESLATFRLPSTDALAGTALDLRLEGGGRLLLEVGERTAAWQADGRDWAGSGDDPVDVVEAAPGTFFIDVDFTEFVRAQEAVTVVVAPATGWALVIHQERFHPEETWSRGPEIRHEFTAARIHGVEQTGDAPAPTRDLIGRRHLYRYSPKNLYEHIYINSQKFVGHNVSTTGTPGRADCHLITHYRFADDVYVVGWREYDSGSAMVALLDLDALRTTAKVLHPEGFLHAVSRGIGGHIIPVGESPDYPDGLQPI